MKYRCIISVVCFGMLLVGCGATTVKKRHYLGAGAQIQVVLVPPGDAKLLGRNGLIEYWQDMKGVVHSRIYVRGAYIDGLLTVDDMGAIGHEFWHWVEFNNRGRVIDPDIYKQ